MCTYAHMCARARYRFKERSRGAPGTTVTVLLAGRVDGREGWQAGIPYGGGGGGDGDGPTRPQGWASVCHAVLYRRSPCRCADATAAATAVARQHSIEYNVCVCSACVRLVASRVCVLFSRDWSFVINIFKRLNSVLSNWPFVGSLLELLNLIYIWKQPKMLNNSCLTMQRVSQRVVIPMRLVIFYH